MSRRATVTQCVIPIKGDGVLTRSLALCGDQPFVAWLMREMQRYGVESFVLLADRPSTPLEQAVDALHRHLPKPARIVLSTGAPQAGTDPGTGTGTRGALRHARGHLEGRFLVCDGDTLFDGNLATLLARAAAEPEVPGWMVLRRREDPGRDAADPVGAGISLVRRDLLDHLPLEGMSGLRGVVIQGGIHQAGIPQLLRRPALLLDRDGVINHDHGWVGTRERFEWTSDGREAIRIATASGWHVFVVTNQSGVARGHYDEAQMDALHDWMIDEIRAGGGTIDDIRACPYHEDAAVPRYRRRSDWRKPAPGMLLDLIRTWDLDPARCVMIGDQPTDMMAAEAAGIAGHLTRGGDLLALLAGLGMTP